MISVFFGIVLVAASGAFLIYCRPRNGAVMPAATMPVLETLIPLAVVSGLALGSAMVAAGLLF